MRESFVPILIYLALVLAVGGGILLLSAILGPQRLRKGKLEPYECGVPLLGQTREPFEVKFYLVAILFVLFDVEIVFLFPWGVIWRELGWAGFIEVGIFVAVLGLGLLYAWSKGMLDWSRREGKQTP